jgi:hypothetical protein
MPALHMLKRVAPIDYTGVPASYVGKCSAVCRTAEECGELVRHFGSPDFAPNLPVMVLVPGGDAPTLIAGMGYATAAELQDCAVVTWEEQTAKIAATGNILDFDMLRERRGLLRREEVDAATRQALLDRVARHKANPISDPFRQPVYENPRQKTKFLIEKEVPGDAT